MLDFAFIRPVFATVASAGGAAVALEAVLESQGPIPSALAALLLALSALVWEHVRRMRDARKAENQDTP